MLRADFILLALILVLAFFLGSFIATNTDLWLHLAVGQRMSAGEFTFGVDPFSWLTEAADGQPAVAWVHHSWLYSYLIFHLNELVGGPGLVIIKAILFAITIGLLSRIGWTEASRWFGLIALATAALAISPRLVLGPIVLSFLFLTTTLLILNRVGLFTHARDEAKPRPHLLWALPPLFALWANVDAWFILGLIVLGLCLVAVGLTRWFPDVKSVRGKTLGLVFGASVAACLVESVSCARLSACRRNWLIWWCR